MVMKMKWNGVIKIYGLWIAMVFLSLLVVPVFAQTITPDKIFTSKKVENHIIVETTDKEWHRSDTNTIEINLGPNFGISDYGITMNLRYDIKAAYGRTTICTYKIYSNGEYIDQITHTLENLQTIKGFSTYDPILIPSEALHEGANAIFVEMTFDSIASEVPSKEDIISLKVVDMAVKEIPKDTDGDGLKDSFDLLNSRNNTYISLILSFAAFPPISAIGIVKKENEE